MKEGTGRGAGGSYRATATFSWEDGGSCAGLRCCVLGEGGCCAPHTGRDGPGRGAGRMWSLLADTWSSKRGSPSQESQLNDQVPSRRWFQGNLVGTFFPRHKD